MVRGRSGNAAAAIASASGELRARVVNLSAVRSAPRNPSRVPRRRSKNGGHEKTELQFVPPSAEVCDAVCRERQGTSKYSAAYGKTQRQEQHNQRAANDLCIGHVDNIPVE